MELPGFSVDITDREAVRRFHLAIYGASEGRAIDWTGDYGSCDSGTTSVEFQEAVIRRVNYYRALVGVPGDVVLDHAYHPSVQSTAYIMSRNGIIAHDLPDDAECYTAEGDAAAGESNLAIGANGPDAIDGYMADWGPNNWPVGHRRWLIVPQQQEMATGDVPGTNGYSPANAIRVIGDTLWDPRPNVRDEFVAWPPPGYVPYAVMPVRWSFSYPDADFSAASVSVRKGGVLQAIEAEPLAGGRGENTIVWHLTSLDTLKEYSWPKPAADTTYDVTVSNVILAGSPREFSYQVKIFDPAVPTPGASSTELTGPTSLPVGVPAAYSLPAIEGVSTFEWVDGNADLLTTVEGADVDLGPFVADISPGYDPRGQKPKFETSKCFLLTHTEPVDQHLTHSGALLPGPGAILNFETRVSNATEGQVGLVQVSMDDGSSWETIYSRAGWYEYDEESETGNYLSDLWFNEVTLPLDAYEGRLIRVRFVYHYVPGNSYILWDPEVSWHNGIGFYVENVSFENVHVLTDISSHDTDAETGVVFTPPVAGTYALAARGLLFGEYPLEWGPAKLVTASGEAPPTVTFEAVPSVVGGMFMASVGLSPAKPSVVLTVERAASAAGPWSVDAQASVTTLQAGARYQISRPASGDAGFIRLRVQ